MAGVKGLVVKKYWVDQILDGSKPWEMRSTMTKYRGLVKLIEGGSGTIVGESILVGCHEVDTEMAKRTFRYHRVEELALLEKWRYAWVMAEAKRYQTPIPYVHPKGAVIWVNL